MRKYSWFPERKSLCVQLTSPNVLSPLLVFVLYPSFARFLSMLFVTPMYLTIAPPSSSSFSPTNASLATIHLEPLLWLVFCLSLVLSSLFSRFVCPLDVCHTLATTFPSFCRRSFALSTLHQLATTTTTAVILVWGMQIGCRHMFFCRCVVLNVLMPSHFVRVVCAQATEQPSQSTFP